MTFCWDITCTTKICKFNFLDIENAFGTSSYPEKLAYKLYLRKGFCLKELGETQKAIEAFNKAEKLLMSSSDIDEKKNEVLMLIKDAKENSEQKISSTDGMLFKETPVLKQVDNPSLHIPEFMSVSSL